MSPTHNIYLVGFPPELDMKNFKHTELMGRKSTANTFTKLDPTINILYVFNQTSIHLSSPPFPDLIF